MGHHGNLQDMPSCIACAEDDWGLGPRVSVSSESWC